MISIIVPVYKVEKYIRECLDSIIAQTYRDWELILIDDGSPDDSGRICEEFKNRTESLFLKKEQIRVIHQENAGASAARNKGIEEAKGEYIAFVDADDILEPKFLEHFNIEDADWSIEGYQRFGEMRSCDLFIQEEIKVSPKELVELCSDKIGVFAPWAKLFKKSIIDAKGIRFPLGMKNAEDIYFCLDYLQNIEIIKMVPFANYRLRYAGSEYDSKYSISTNEYNFHIKKILKQLNKTEKVLNNHLPSYRNILTSRFWNFYRTWLLKQDRGKRLYEILKYTGFGLFRYSGVKESMSLYFMSLFPAVYSKFHKN